MRILRAADHRRMAWKNGGGMTWEVAADPPDAALDAFDWRLSMAAVQRPGPFSLFPGCDRVLTVLSGGPMSLSLDGRAVVSLDAASDPYPFPADLPCEVTALGSPLVDLNVMVRRGRARTGVSRHSGAPLQLDSQPALRFVLVRGGPCRLDGAGDLAENDVACIEAGGAAILRPAPGATLYAVTVERL